MNEPTKPAAKAVAIAHKTPSRAMIDTAQDELANLNYKLGRAQVAAMLSAGQAKADKAALSELETLVEEKRSALEAMVAAHTNPTRPDSAAALEAIREKLGNVDQANAPGAPGDPAVAASKPADGGVVKPGPAYLVGEKTADAIVPEQPAKRALTVDVKPMREALTTAQAGADALSHAMVKIPADKEIQIIHVSGTVSAERAAKLAAHRNSRRDPLVAFDADTNPGDMPPTALKASAVDKIENVKPGDVEIPDSAERDYPDFGRAGAKYSGATAPTHTPNTGDIWADTSVSPPFHRTWDGVRWAPAFPPAKAHTGPRPPIDPVNGDRWIYPGRSDREMYFDDVEGWLARFTPDDQPRRVVASDLSSDFWEKGELDHVLNKARPRKQLFSKA